MRPMTEEHAPAIRGEIASGISPAKQGGIEVRPVRQLDVGNEGELKPVDRSFDRTQLRESNSEESETCDALCS
jgi:hypothetical protein